MQRVNVVLLRKLDLARDPSASDPKPSNLKKQYIKNCNIFFSVFLLQTLSKLAIVEQSEICRTK
jgi:hypothetical protein